MPNLNKADKAAKRRERRRLRRMNNKNTGVIEAAKLPIAADQFPMIYDWKDPTSYQEGYKSTATMWKSLTSLVGDKEDSHYLRIACHGKYTINVQPDGSFRDFVVDYYVPMEKLGQLGKKKVTSVDLINRNKEKKGTLYAQENGHLCFVARRDDLIISGETTKEYLAEQIHEGTQGGCNIIVKAVGKTQSGDHDHVWEKRIGVFTPKQTDPTHLYHCTVCGVRYKCGPNGYPPTKGCTGEAHA